MKRVNLNYLAIVFAVAAFSCAPASERKEKSAEAPVTSAPPPAVKMPDITLISRDGGLFSSATLPGQTILIFFGADCGHCQREAGQIQAHLEAFKAYNIYFISMDPFPEIDRFAETYGLRDPPNVHFVRADGGSVFQAMGYMQTPTICIYASTKKLVKRFDGETPIGDILKLLDSI